MPPNNHQTTRGKMAAKHILIEKNSAWIGQDNKNGAGSGIRTRTALRPPAPKAGVSAISPPRQWCITKCSGLRSPLPRLDRSDSILRLTPFASGGTAHGHDRRRSLGPQTVRANRAV